MPKRLPDLPLGRVEVDVIFLDFLSSGARQRIAGLASCLVRYEVVPAIAACVFQPNADAIARHQFSTEHQMHGETSGRRAILKFDGPAARCARVLHH